MSIARSAASSSLAFGVSLALCCGACTTDSNTALFGTPDETAAGGRASAGGGSGSGETTAANGGSTPSSEAGGASESSGGESGTNGGSTGAGGADPAGSGGLGGGVAGRGAGGRTGSGGATPGSGGRDADAGPTGAGGNMADAGNAGAVASGGVVGAGGMTAVPAMIRCGDTSCDKSAGEICCIRDVPTMMMSTTRMAATCAKDGANCDRVFRCDSDADCARGEHCCMDFTSSPTTPSTACSARACDAPLACSLPSDCAHGQTCCGAIGGTMSGVKYTSLTCETTCPALSSTFCENGSSSCSGNATCQQSLTLPPGYFVCRGGAGP